jgi:hypothetical protein
MNLRLLCRFLLPVALVCAQARAAERPKIEISLASADRHLAKLPPQDPWERNPDASTLAWGESHLLHALVDLYEATGDAKYLAEVARRGDRLLAHRDDRRGVADGSGKIRPAWSMASKYVVAEGAIRDAAGREVARLRSTRSAQNNQTKVELAPDAEAPGRYRLTVSNSHFRRTERWTGLDLAQVAVAVNAERQPLPTRPGEVDGKPSALLTWQPVAGATGAVPAQTVQLRPIPLAFMGYLGVIYHPLVRLADHVRKHPALAELAPAAARFVAAAEESYADADARLWREGPAAGEGYYLTCERGESFPYDNVGQPFNFLGRHAATQFALARLTGKAAYRERAEKLVRLFVNRLRHDPKSDLYVWHYWYEPVTTTGWSAEKSPSFNLPNQPRAPAIEDVSHGALDIAMVVAAAEAGVVIGPTELGRFARTLLVNVLNPGRTGIRPRVDGSGKDYPDYFPALSVWLDLAAADPAVYREIRRTVETGGPDHLQLIAALLKWERRLGAAGATPR